MKRFIIILFLLIVLMIGGMIFLSASDVAIESKNVQKTIQLSPDTVESEN